MTLIKFDEEPTLSAFTFMCKDSSFYIVFIKRKKEGYEATYQFKHEVLHKEQFTCTKTPDYITARLMLSLFLSSR